MAKRKLENALALMLSMEARLHRLRNTIPCGMRSIDDRTDQQIEQVTADLAELKAKIMILRVEAKKAA